MEYFKIINKYSHFKGKRFFRVDRKKQTVLQVCIEPGENIRGKNSLVGIYEIKLNTFLTNYYFPNHDYNYVERCSLELFKKMFEEAVFKLQS